MEIINLLNNTFRFLIAIFAVYLSTTSGLFLIGEVVFGIDYLISSTVLIFLLYSFSVIKLIALLSVVLLLVSARVSKYEKVMDYLLLFTLVICIVHLLFIVLAFFTLIELNDYFLFMGRDSLFNIFLLVSYFISVKLSKIRG